MAAKGMRRGGKCVKRCEKGVEELVKRWEGVGIVCRSWGKDGKCVEGEGKGEDKRRNSEEGLESVKGLEECKEFRVCAEGVEWLLLDEDDYLV